MNEYMEKYYSISTWIYENWVTKHFVISLKFPCLKFPCLRSDSLWLGICVEEAVKEILQIPILSNPPFLPRECFPILTQNSLSNTSDSYLKSVHP